MYYYSYFTLYHIIGLLPNTDMWSLAKKWIFLGRDEELNKMSL